MIDTLEKEQTTVSFLNTDTMTRVTMPVPRVISRRESREMQYAYRDGALARNSEILGKKDSTSAWLPKETLIALLEACDGKPNEAGNEGVLVNWATYPLDHPDPALAGRQTIVIHADADNWFGDIYPCPAYCAFTYTPNPG